MNQSAPEGSREVGTATSSGREDVQAQAQEVGQKASQEASQVAGSARDSATQVKEEAAVQTRRVAREAADAAKREAHDQTSRAASALQRTGDQLQALGEGRPDEAGPVGDYVQRAASQVQDWAQRIESRGLDGVLADLQRFARRKPGTFLLGAAAAGMVAGRLARNTSGDSPGTSSTGAAAADRPAPPSARSGPDVNNADPAAEDAVMVSDESGTHVRREGPKGT